MAKQLNVNLSFTANTQQAKAQLLDLQNQLTKLLNNPQSDLGITKEIQKASVAVATLKTQLEGAVNVNTGKLDLGKFNQSLQQSGYKINDYKDALLTLGPQGERAFSTLAQSITTAEVPLKRGNALLTEFATTLKNTARWQISSSILHGFMGSVQAAYGYAKDLNESLNNIRIVTGQNTDQMAEFAKQANASAKALSTTTTRYTDAALIYYQQGLSDEEVKERTDVTVKMANVAGETATEVSDQMTAVWNNFNKAGDQSAEHFADVMTALGAATATSTDEIAEGLQKFSGIADTVGLSFDYATAALATITATSRESADVVGTALKTIFGRMEGLKLDETLEDGTDLTKYSQALADVGVDIKSASGDLKDMDTILEETAAAWGNLTQAQKVATAQTVAGVRQYNQFMTLMENWDFMQENLATARGSAGTLQEQADIYAESWEAASTRVRASMETIYSQLVNDDFFIEITNGTAKLIDGINNIIDTMGGLKGVVATLGTLFITLFKGQITESLQNTAYNLRMLTKTGRESILQLREQTNQAVATLYIDSANPIGEQIGKAYSAQASAQQTLLQNAKNMTSEQQQIAQLLLDQHNTLVQNAVAQGEVAQQAEHEAEVIARRQQAQSNRIANKNLQEGNTTFASMSGYSKTLGSNVKKEIANYQQLTKQAANFKTVMEGAFGGATQNAQTYIAKIQAIKAVMGDDAVTVEQFGTKGAKAFKEFEEAILSAEDDPIKIEQALDKLVNQIDEVIIKAEKAENRVKNLGVDTTKSTQAFQSAGAEMGNLTLRTTETEESVGKFSDKLNDIPKATKGSLEGIVGLAQGLGSLAMAISSIQGIYDTLTDPDLSTWEKFLSIITTVGFTLPMVVSGMKDLAAGINLIIPASSAAAAGEVAIGTAGATAGATALTGLFPLIAILGGIALAIGGVVVGFQQWYKSTPEGKLEQTRKEAELLSESFDQITSKVSEVNNAFSQYESAKTALEELTVGTQEWSDAVVTLNENVLNLIDKYPELADGLNISNGVLSINEQVMKDFTEELRKQQALTSIAKADASPVGSEEQIDVDRREAFNKTTLNNYETLDIRGGNTTTQTLEKVSANTVLTFEEYNKVLEAVKEQGSEILKNEDKLTGELGLSEKVAESISKSKETQAQIETQIEKEKSQQLQKEAQRTAAVTNYLTQSNNLKYNQLVENDTETGDNKSAFVSRIVENNTQQGTEAFEKAFNALDSLSPEEYLKTFEGLTESSENWNDRLKEVTANFENIKNEIAAANAVEEYVDKNLSNIVDKVNQIHIPPDLQGFITGEDIDFNKIGALTAETIRNMEDAVDVKRIFNIGEGTLQQLGFENADAFIKYCQERLDQAELNKDNVIDQLSIDSQDAEQIAASFAGLADEAEQLAPFKKIYDKIAEGKGVDWKALTSDVKGGFKEIFSAYGEEYDALMKAVTSNPNDLKKQQKAWDGLITAWVNGADQFQKVNKKTAASAKALLKEMNVVNSDEVIDSIVERNEAREKEAKKIRKLKDEYEDYTSILREVAENQENADVILQRGDNLEKYQKGIKSITEALSVLTGQDTADISKMFNVEGIGASKEALEELELALTGDEQALRRLKAEFTNIEEFKFEPELDTENFRNQLNAFVNAFDGYDLGTAEGRAEFNAQPYLASLANALNITKSTVGQLEALLSSITGSTIKIEYETQTIEVPSILGTTPKGYYNVPGAGKVKLGGTTADIITEKRTIRVPKIVSAKAKTGGNNAHVKTAPVQTGSSGNNSGGGGKGGKGGKGSGSNKEVTAKKIKKDKDEYDFYRDLNEKLEQNQHLLTQIGKEEDALSGNKLIKKLKEENQVYKDRNKLLAKLEERYKKDQKRQYKTLGVTYKKDKNGKETNKIAKNPFGLKFDEYGNITNYKEVWKKVGKDYDKQVNDYNEKVDEYNRLKRKGKKRNAEEEKRFKKLKEYFDDKGKHEKDEANIEKAKTKRDERREALDTISSIGSDRIQNQEEIDENLREIISNNFEAFELKFKLTIDVREAKKELNSFLKTFNTDFKKSTKSVEDWNKEFTYTLKEAKLDKGEFNQRLKKVKEIQDILDNSKYNYGGANSKFENRSAALEAYTEAIDELREGGLEIHELYEQSWDTYLDAIDDVIDQWNKLLDGFDRIDDTLSHYESVTELLYGDSDSQAGRNQLDSIYTLELQSANERLNVLMAERNSLQAEMAELSGDAANEDMQKVQEAIDENSSNVQAAIENYIQTAQNLLINSIKSILYTADKELMNGFSNDTVSERWSDAKDAAQGYYDEVERVYQLEKMESAWEDVLNSTKVLKNQQYLKTIMDSQLKNLREKTDLSEYDVQLAEKELAIYKAQIALEEAQNNKNSMKLVRNAQGNWSYQYVADVDEISKKEQDLSNALYEKYEFIKTNSEQTMSDILSIYQTAQQKISELLQEYVYADEGRRAEIKEQYDYLEEYYFGKNGRITKLATKSTGMQTDLNVSGMEVVWDLYKTDEENFALMTQNEQNLVSSLTSFGINSFSDLATKVATGGDSFYNQIQNKCASVVDEGRSQWSTFAYEIVDQWADSPESVRAKISGAYDEILEKVGDYDKSIQQLEKTTGISVTNMKDNYDKMSLSISKASSNIDDLKTKTSELSNYYKYVEDLGALWTKVADEIERASKAEVKATQELFDGKTQTYGDETGSSSNPSSIKSYNFNSSGKRYTVTNDRDTNYVLKTEDGYAYSSNSKYGLIANLQKRGFSKEIIDKVSALLNYSLAAVPVTNVSSSSSLGKITKKFDSGGYTGDWNDGSGKLGILHSKELVLNKEDTQNILDTVNIVRNIKDKVSGIISGLMNFGSNSINNIGKQSNNTEEQQVFNITAEFPNANSVDEIREAILSLPNIASQYSFQNTK